MVGLSRIFLIVDVLIHPRNVLNLFAGYWSISVVVPTLLLISCSDRQHRNPFDPETKNSDVIISHLRAIAGDRRVTLKWDYTQFKDISGLELNRWAGENAETKVISLGANNASYVDTEVQNGIEYNYRLTLIIAGEGKRDVGTWERATPGTAIAWVADTGTGLVWRLAPDGRNSLFAQGRFSFLTSIAADTWDGSCWVSDRGYSGLYRIDGDGNIEQISVAIAEVEFFAIEPKNRIGWIIDGSGNNVWWVSLNSLQDSLRLNPVDAHFSKAVSLYPVFEACWIVDRDASRVVLYHNTGARIDEWPKLDSPLKIATSSKTEVADEFGRYYSSVAWVLIDGGRRVAKLEVGVDKQVIDLPFSGAIAADVDELNGNCWILAPNDLAAYDRQGMLLAHWDDLPEAQDFAIDARHEQIWIVGDDSVWKMGMDQGDLTRLQGFRKPFRIVVDAGQGL